MKKGKKFFSNNAQQITLIILIILISIIVQIRTEGRFLSPSNLYDLFRESAILMMVSVGMMIVMISGGIDLAVGSIMGLSGMLCALTLRDHRSTPIWALFLLAIFIGLISGLLNGLVVAKLRIYPLIGTLGVSDILRGMVYVFSKGVWVGQGEMTKEFMAISTDSVLGINNLVVIAIVITIIGGFFLNYTRTGRYIYAVGNSPESAIISGINPEKIKFIAYIICGVISGLAGLLWICKFGNAQGDSANGFELNVIAATVLGGVSITGGAGKITGVVLGVLLFGILNNILPLIKVSAFWQMGIKGAVIIISIVVNAITRRYAQKRALERRALYGTEAAE